MCVEGVTLAMLPQGSFSLLEDTGGLNVFNKLDGY